MKIIILFLSFSFAALTNGDSKGERNLIQISCANSDENSSVRALKALFIPCTSKTSKCISRVEVRGFLNANEKRETFLLIDEVFDLKEQAHLPLLHPYLIQVSATETIASFPLHFEQFVDVSCSGNDVQRRATYHEDFPFTAEQLHSYDDLLNDIIITSKKEANAIKEKDIQNYMNDNVEKAQSDLLLYFDNDDTTPQTVNMKNFIPNQHNAAIQIELENLLKLYENESKFSGSPQTDANANQSFNDHSKNHKMAEIENRFSINQDKDGDETERSTGVINHHYHGHESGKHLPDEIDIRLSFNHPKNFRRAIDASNVNQNQLGELQQLHKSELRNHKFSSDDNRKVFTAYDNRQRQNNDYYYHDDGADDRNQFEPIDIEDDPNMLIEENELNTKVLHADAAASFTNNLHKVNAFQKDAISKDKFKRNEVEISHKDEIKLRLSKEEDEMKKKEARRYSVYSLDEPTYNRSSIKIQIFRMYNQTWIKVQPSIAIANETITNSSSSNNSNESSMRKSFSQTLDRNHAKLLVLNNELSLSSSSIIEYQNELNEKFADAVEKSICTRNDVLMKRSIIKLNEADVVLPDNERRAIMQCPSNVDQLCLNFREKNDARRLNVVIPFQHNELLDKRSPFVKISNIYIDTSDSDELFTQFEITSMDHFTQQFNLSFGDCDILERLNVVSHTFTLSPNKSKLINMTFPLPFNATVEHKEHKCKVNILSGRKIIAQREFLINTREKRCLCLWMCSCFCFDSFLSTEIKDLCHIMSAKNEIYAGFYDEQSFDEIEEEIDGWNCWKKLLMLMPLAIILFVLFMGCIKAILGCCFKRIDSWKFNRVQSCVSYRESSRCWKVFVNILFFFLLPIASCIRCSDCCCSYDDEKVNSENSVYGRSVVRKEIYSDDDDSDDDKIGKDEENWKLLKPNAPSSDYSTIFEHYNRSSETIFNVPNLSNPFDEKQQQQQSDEDEMLVKDTEYVVSAINESHESLRKLSHHSEENIENDERFETAQRVVKEFLAARIVYRHFNQPIGNVKINDSQSYSIRGYFVPAQSTGYQFITYNPIKQFYQVSSSSILVALAPQIQLDPKAFRRYYANKIEVLEAGDLSLKPSPSAPCINVLVQDKSMYGS
ncbi:hypothetical protein PVAND_002280 [Polypedilum vanderplanki]|uniref:Generative cell specific-1/HAP2 domain-containing protein n=1 Tax=Polypedilum vanderplanki TaxID=319348 RepID=A0A9J6BR36_POLVA|nr:hypothetical protein PVAND_002280 [Polypedilum vanderplanki]